MRQTEPQMETHLHGTTCRHEALPRLLWGAKEDTEVRMGGGGETASRG